MADLRISDLPPLAGADLASNDIFPLTDASSSETKRITAKGLIENGIALLDNGSIPVDKIEGGGLGSTTAPAQFLAGPTDAAGAVSARVIVGTDLPAATGSARGGVQIGTGLNVTDGLVAVAPATSAVVGGVYVGLGSGLSVSADGALTHTDTIAAGTANGFTWNSTGHITAVTAIPASDLPIATTTTIGAVKIGSGLVVTADGQLNHESTITPGTSAGITYNSTGHITAVGPIGTDALPKATTTEVGVSSYPTTGGLTVTGAGAASIATTGVAAGSYTKLTVNDRGQATAGGTLQESDIPNISADKLNGGEINPGLIPDRSIEEIKLSDYSTCLIQEGEPSGNYKLGQLWFTPSTSQLRVYGRGSSGDLWLSIGFGALQQQNLRWGGTVNAADSTITTLTDIGVSEGLTAGGPIPTPTDELSGLYFVVATSGSGITIPNVNGDLCTEGDWILYISQAEGAIHLDISAGGGGGGGGVTKLSELTDVDLSTLQAGDLLQYDAISGMWKNTLVINGGTF